MYESNVAMSSSDKLTLNFTPQCYLGSIAVATVGRTRMGLSCPRSVDPAYESLAAHDFAALVRHDA
jgi:hypothetical protein